ncbi:MAG: ABC transporter substrate-binding protein [Pikeienuella sp.]
MKHMIVGPAFAAALIAAAASAQTPQKGGVFTVAIDGPRHLNPAVQSGNATGIPGVQIFAGLVELDAAFQPQPYLADSWTVSDDGLIYEFRLNEAAVFHDGQPVTSADVAYSLGVVKANHPFGIAMFGAVDRVETPDPKTVRIVLSAPSPALMASLSPVLLPILPKHVYDDGQEIKTHPANSRPVGSGPFMFEEYIEGRYVSVKAFPDFFREGRPYLDEIVFRIMPETEQQSRLISIEAGEVDYLPFSGMNSRNVERLKQRSDLTVTTDGFGAIGPVNYLEFNLRQPPFDNILVRRALAHMIDRDFITRALHRGQSKRLDGPLHSSSPFYDAGALTRYEVDPEKAKALLSEAGYEPGANGIRFKMVLDIPTTHPESGKLVAEYLKSRLAEIGIEVELRPTPDFATWAKRIADWSYEATMSSAFNYPDPIIGVHRLFLCANIRNVVWSNTEGYCNETLDATLKTAASATDMETRRAAYSEFQRIITEDLPMIFTNEEPYTAVYRDNVMDPPLTVWGAMQPMDGVWLKTE